MASRWRIRHKLMVWLGLVVLLNAVLLSGTLRGLWSYYLTTNSIRFKLHELFAAEQLKAAVVDLIAPENTARMIRKPELVPEEISQARSALDAYAHQVEETVTNSHDSRRGRFEKECVGELEHELALYEKAVKKSINEPRVGGMLSDEKHLEEVLKFKELASSRGRLLRGAVDLRDGLKVELGERFYATRSHYQIPLWIAGAATIVGMIVLVGLLRSFYAWVLTPIRDLEKGVDRVAKGDLEHRIDLHSGDEMEDLGRAFNDMVGRLQEVYADLARQVNERSRQLVRSERLASVGFLAAGVAHEINNPLASIAFCSEALEARLEAMMRFPRGANNRAAEEQEVFGKYLKMIQEEAFRCKSITERLLEFSRTGEPRREPTDLRALVQSVLDVTQHLANHKGKQILLEVPPDRVGRLIAVVNPEEIKSVVLNLVVNALESIDEDGALTIRLGQRDGQAELRFTDTGCGMTQEVLDNIFEPFFTRSRTGKGTGLGLTISHLIISQHGGEIQVSSAGPGQGSSFVVRLPTRPAEKVADGTIGSAVPTTGPAVRTRAA